MSTPAQGGWMVTGAPMRDTRWWLDNTNLPPALRTTYEAEYEAKKAEISARVMEQVARDQANWVETFDTYSGELDAVADAYVDARARALDGRLTASAYDQELVTLDARRRALDGRATEPERVAERIATIATDPVAFHDDLLRRYPSLPRPQFSFVPVRGL